MRQLHNHYKRNAKTRQTDAFSNPKTELWSAGVVV